MLYHSHNNFRGDIISEIILPPHRALSKDHKVTIRIQDPHLHMHPMHQLLQLMRMILRMMAKGVIPEFMALRGWKRKNFWKIGLWAWLHSIDSESGGRRYCSLLSITFYEKIWIDITLRCQDNSGREKGGHGSLKVWRIPNSTWFGNFTPIRISRRGLRWWKWGT